MHHEEHSMKNIVRTRSNNQKPVTDLQDRYESVLKEHVRTRLFMVDLADLIQVKESEAPHMLKEVKSLEVYGAT